MISAKYTCACRCCAMCGGIFLLFLVLLPAIMVLPGEAGGAQGEDLPVCPPNSAWNGSECKCLNGYGSLDGETCRPMSELITCPANSSWDGSRCTCLEGYGSLDNETCVLLSSLAQCPPHSSWDGRQCKCDPGYGVYGDENKCTSLYEICRRLDPVAVYNPAVNDCQCPEGYRENKAANRCEPVARRPQNAGNNPVPAKKERMPPSQPDAAGEPEIVSGNRSGGDLQVRLENGLLPGSNGQVIDASSRPGGDFNAPVWIGGKTVYMTGEGAAAYGRMKESGAHDKIGVLPDREAESDWWAEPATDAGGGDREGKGTAAEEKSSFWAE